AAELPDNLPPLDDVTAPEPLPRKPLPPRLVQRPATEIQAQPEKLEAPPEKEQAVAPPPKPRDKEHQKMVDLDMGQEVEPPPDAPSLERDPDWLKPLVMDRPESVKDLAGKPGTNQTPRLALSGKQYQYLFGDDAEAAKELASKVRSRKQGRFSERMGKIQSAL